MSREERRAEAIIVAEAFLRREIDLIEAAQRLARLRFHWEAEQDEDFLYFVGIESDTDHLPTGPERAYWNRQALDEKDEERQEVIKLYGQEARAACRRIVERYRSGGSSR